MGNSKIFSVSDAAPDEAPAPPRRRGPSRLFIVIIAIAIVVSAVILYLENFQPMLFEKILNAMGIDTGYSEQGVIRRFF